MTATARWVVLELGGSDLQPSEAWKTLLPVAIAYRSEGLRPVVVHPALPGVRARLEEAVAAGRAGAHEAVVAELEGRHQRLAEELGVPGEAGLAERWLELRRLLQTIPPGAQASPALRARVLAQGDLAAAGLAAAYFADRGVPASLVEGREALLADPPLGAASPPADDAVVTPRSSALEEGGGPARTGPGGSELTAARLAAGLEAERLEIWTDVPGMFSADPRLVPSARLLKSLSYEEAQEIASTGGGLLHPGAIGTVRDRGIPVHFRSLRSPGMPGTIVAAAHDDAPGRVKAISRRSDVTLVSMESLSMWQEAGFLARAFDVFREHGVSVDLVSTSETMVTVSLDPAASGLTDGALDGLVSDLGAFCQATVVEGTAALSLVGRHIRAMIYRLGPVLEVFQEERIHLVSQAASDLNLTFVVDEEQADRLLSRLHSLLIRAADDDPIFGPTWEALTRPSTVAVPPPPAWWERKRDRLLELMTGRECAYVYDLDTVRERARMLRSLRSVDRVFYSLKANPHPAILRALRQAGLGFECVSAAEIRHLDGLFPDLAGEDVLFTPNFAPREEYELGLRRGVAVTLDALHPLRHWPELFRDREILIRVDPGRGEGHHEKVRTAGGGSKFGLPVEVLPEVRDRLAAVSGRVVGLHAHSGSGILDSSHWARVGRILADLRPLFPEVRVIDLGGGLGVPDRPGGGGLDLDRLDTLLEPLRSAIPGVELWLEPGRFLVAEAGVLLARVTQLKRKGPVRFVGVATGMNSLLRPALYGAFHEIRSLSRPDASRTRATTVVGPICETGDRFGTDHLLPEADEGDVLLIANTGAYGHVMSSRYNLREPAEELVLDE